MPLPNAPHPENSILYQQLRSKKLEDLTPDQLDKWRDQIFVNGDNEDDIRRLILLYIASGNMMTSPIPRTQKLVQATYTSTGDDADFFKPDAGEVWQLVGGDTLGNGGTGSIQWSLKDADGKTALIFQTSVSGQEPIGQNSTNNNMMNPVYITSDNWLYANISAVATSVRATMSFIRVS
jgi:hypothetical protein